jgi:hypothetical protein
VLYRLKIIAKHKPVIGKKIMGKIIRFTTDDKTAMPVNSATTKNSLEENNTLSGFINAIINEHKHIKNLSIGTDVSVFTVQNKSSIIKNRLTILTSTQCPKFNEDGCTCFKEISCTKILIV